MKAIAFLIVFMLIPIKAYSLSITSDNKSSESCMMLSDTYEHYMKSISALDIEGYKNTRTKPILDRMNNLLSDKDKWKDYLKRQNDYVLKQQNINKFEFINCTVEGNQARSIYHSEINTDKSNTVGFFVVMFTKEKNDWKIGFATSFRNMAKDTAQLNTKMKEEPFKSRMLLPSEK